MMNILTQLEHCSSSSSRAITRPGVTDSRIKRMEMREAHGPIKKTRKDNEKERFKRVKDEL